MYEKPRITRLHALDDPFFAFFVADHVLPGRERDRDGVWDHGRDGTAERT